MNLFNRNIRKIDTEEELINQLKRYKGILTGEKIDYLESLIGLEFSVIKKLITEDERKSLSELEIYKKIATYNIYKRALNVLDKVTNNDILRLYGNSEGNEGLIISVIREKDSIPVFDFNYRNGSIGFDSRIPDGYRTNHVGNIALYQTLYNEEYRNAEMDRVLNVLENLYDEKNPYHSAPNAFGGPASTWTFEHQDKIKIYEDKFRELDSKDGLSDKDREEISISKYYYDLFLDDFGMFNKEFSNEDDGPFASKKVSELNKILVKKVPGITIKNNIKYV